ALLLTAARCSVCVEGDSLGAAAGVLAAGFPPQRYGRFRGRDEDACLLSRRHLCGGIVLFHFAAVLADLLTVNYRRSAVAYRSHRRPPGGAGHPGAGLPPRARGLGPATQRDTSGAGSGGLLRAELML